MTLHHLMGRLRAFQREEGGNTVVSYAVILPVLVLAVFGSAVLIQLLWLKLMLSSGVYDAAQHVTYTGGRVPYQQWTTRYQGDLKLIVQERLPHGSFLAQYVANASDGSTVRVDVQPLKAGRGGQPCDGADTGVGVNADNLRFTVTAKLDIAPARGLPFLGKIQPFTLTEQAGGFLDCPRWEPMTQREGCVFPGRCP